MICYVMICYVMSCHVMERDMNQTMPYFLLNFIPDILVEITHHTLTSGVLSFYFSTYLLHYMFKNYYSATRLVRKNGHDCATQWEVAACDLLSDALRTGGEWMTR